MTDLFDDNDEEKAILVDEDLVEVEDVIVDVRQRPTSDARRRLENLMEDKRLRNELEDFIDEY